MTNTNKTAQKLRSEISGLIKQITRMKMSEKACLEKQKKLESSEAKLQLLLETTPARIVNLDHNGNILYINHTTTRRTIKEVRGKNVYDLLSPEEQKKLKQILRTVIKTGRKYRYEPYIIHPDGKTNWYENTVAPVKRNGKVVEFIITSADTTERIKAKIELQKALDELKRSEQKRLLFLKAAPERIVNTDLNGKLLYVNRAETMRVQDIIGADITQFVAPEERNKLRQIMKSVAQTGKKRFYEIQFISHDGKKFFFDCTASPIKEDGKVVEILIIAADITERKKTEAALQKAHDALEQRVRERTNELTKTNLFMKQEIDERKQADKALKEREEMLRSILDSSPDAITVTDSKGTIIECNQSNVEMLGYPSKDELIGKSSFDLITKKDQKRAMKNSEKTLKEGVVKNIEYTLLKKDGTEFPAEMSASVVQDASGRLAGFVAIIKDITERRKAEEALIKSETELRKQKLTLEEKNIALREIIAQIEIEKRKIEEDIDTNVNLVLSPILDRLKTNEDDKNYVKLIEHHLKGLTSSFGSKIMDKSAGLTPREIDICAMIKGGMTSKDISKLLNISNQTVEQHRKNIRHKLGITNRGINLTSYLRKM